MRSILGAVSPVVAAAALVLLSMAGGVAVADEFELTTRLDASSLEFHNLAGEILVEGHDGEDFEVVVRVRGRDANRDRVRLIEDGGRLAKISVGFPTDESRRYVYPQLGSHSVKISESRGQIGWLSRLLSGGRDTIEISRSGRGLELWADATIRVPRGGELVLRHGVGRIAASEVRGDLDLDSHSGPVEVSRVAGRLRVDTGSGHVSVERCDIDELEIDTGSGRVDVSEIAAERLHIDTGSGRVSAHGISAESVLIDTGSGAVELDLDTLDDGDYEIDTGSGSVTVTLPRGASVDIRADTGSGGIDVDLGQLHDVDRSDDDEARIIVGDGRARFVIDTGSGRIRVGERG